MSKHSPCSGPALGATDGQTTSAQPAANAPLASRARIGQWLGRDRFAGVAVAIALALGAGGLTRLLLLLKSRGDVAWDASLLRAFAWGSVFDLGAALWWSIGVVIGLAVLPAGFFQRRQHPTEGDYFEMQPPVHFSAGLRTPAAYPPTLGEHGDTIRQDMAGRHPR